MSVAVQGVALLPKARAQVQARSLRAGMHPAARRLLAPAAPATVWSICKVHVLWAVVAAVAGVALLVPSLVAWSTSSNAGLDLVALSVLAGAAVWVVMSKVAEVRRERWYFQIRTLQVVAAHDQVFWAQAVVRDLHRRSALACALLEPMAAVVEQFTQVAFTEAQMSSSPARTATSAAEHVQTCMELAAVALTAAWAVRDGLTLPDPVELPAGMSPIAQVTAVLSAACPV